MPLDCDETVDNVTIKTFVGVVHLEPFAFLEQNEDGTPGDPLDISTWRLEIAVTEGTPEYPGTEIHRFTAANGGITKDTPTGTFTLVMTTAVADSITAKRYAMHSALFDGTDTDPFDIPFRGWLHHRLSGE
jgi:hypothetical protein